MSDPIPPQDLVFLLLDRTGTPSNVGIVLVFDAPPGRTASACAREALRKFRAAVPRPPFERVPEYPGLGLPRWRTGVVADPLYHVQRTTLPAPGRMATLEQRVADLHAAPLDPTRPLFRVHLFDGLQGDRFALYVKTHHALWDGRAAMARIFGALGREPGPIGPPFFALYLEDGSDRPAPPGDAGPSLMERAVERARALEQSLRAVADMAARRHDTAAPSGNAPFAGPYTLLNGPLGASRGFATLSLPLEALRRLGATCGGTVNDALLAVIDEALERYLVRRGERPRRALVSMCPLSVRQPGDVEATTKAVALFVRLARPGSTPMARLREVAANAAEAKRELRGLSTQAALDCGLLVFGAGIVTRSLGGRSSLPPPVNLTVSNVGGVEGPRFLGAARLVGAYPVSMLAEPVGLNVTAVSCDGRLDLGLVADRDAVPDVATIAELCDAAFVRLQRSASRVQRSQDLSLRKPPRRSVSRTRRMPASQRG